jgi:hypothetical protein
MVLLNMARPKRRQLSMYLDEGIATLGSWARHRGFVIRDVVPCGSEPDFPKWAEKYQDRVYYRITDLDEYFSKRPSVTGITMEEAKKITNKFVNLLKDTDNVW